MRSTSYVQQNFNSKTTLGSDEKMVLIIRSSYYRVLMKTRRTICEDIDFIPKWSSGWFFKERFYGVNRE